MIITETFISQNRIQSHHQIKAITYSALLCSTDNKPCLDEGDLYTKGLLAPGLQEWLFFSLQTMEENAFKMVVLMIFKMRQTKVNFLMGGEEQSCLLLTIVKLYLKYNLIPSTDIWRRL